MKNKKHQLKNKYFKHHAVLAVVVLVLGLFLAYSNQPQNITGNVVLPASAQNNLKLYVKFEDIARDEVTLQSGIESIGIGYAPGAEGDAVSFSSGSGKYVSFGERSDLIMTTGFTIHASIYPTGDGIIVNKEGEYEIALISGKVKYAIGNPSPTVAWSWIDTNYTVPLNQWTNVTLNYSSVSGASLFINGNPVYSGGPYYAIGDDIPTQNEFRIGNRQALDQQFHGKIDNVIVYNRALSISEIQQLNLQTPSTSIANGFKISNALTTQPNYLSFQATIRPSTVNPGWQAIVEQGSGSAIGWHLYQNGKKLYVNFDGGYYTGDVILNTSTPYIVNFTKIGNTLTIYVNGQSVGTKTLTGMILVGDGVYIGIRKNGNQYPYQGQISGASLTVGTTTQTCTSNDFEFTTACPTSCGQTATTQNATKKSSSNCQGGTAPARQCAATAACAGTADFSFSTTGGWQTLTTTNCGTRNSGVTCGIDAINPVDLKKEYRIINNYDGITRLLSCSEYNINELHCQSGDDVIIGNAWGKMQIIITNSPNVQGNSFIQITQLGSVNYPGASGWWVVQSR